PPLQRFRIVLEFALSGHRELDGMIDQHAAMARSFAEQLGLSGGVREALGTAYEQWDGRGWPGVLKEEQIPIAARIAQLAEFVEVAQRVGGPAEAARIARRGAGKQFDPHLAALIADDGERLLDGLGEIGTWEAVIASEPALWLVVPNDQL